MNMFKSNGGFTLVELIVVIAILAILAGVAVPAYSGYISKANDTAVLSDLSALETAAQAAAAMIGGSVDMIVVNDDGSYNTYFLTIDESSKAMTQAAAFTGTSEFFEGNVSGKALDQHSQYNAGCTWVAVTCEDAAGTVFNAGWNAGIAVLPTANAG